MALLHYLVRFDGVKGKLQKSLPLLSRPLQGRATSCVCSVSYYYYYYYYFFSHSRFCPHVYGKTTAWIFMNNGSYERSPPGVVPFVIFIGLIGLILLSAKNLPKFGPLNFQSPICRTTNASSVQIQGSCQKATLRNIELFPHNQLKMCQKAYL